MHETCCKLVKHLWWCTFELKKFYKSLYVKKKLHKSALRDLVEFFAFFPVDSPKYAILITVNEPKGAYYGAAVALPPVKSVLEKLIKYKGINPEGIVKNTNLVRQTKNKAVKKDLSKIKNEFNDGVMPDLTEISLREFISVYPHQKFSKYKVSGSGKVKSQFPLPGVKITKDSEIKINLE